MTKIIVITGGGEGLGRATARRFAADGHELVLLGRTIVTLQSVATEIGQNTICFRCDVGSPDSVQSAFAEIARHHPRIDVLINNAAIFEPFVMADAKPDYVLKTIATNLTGPILCTHSAIPLLRGGGRIINVSSESVDNNLPHLSVYQSTKAGLERFSKAMYEELGPEGIRVTVLRAGTMSEPGRQQKISDPAPWVRFHEAASKRGFDLRTLPISTFASAAEIISAIVNLPSDVQIEMIAQHAWRGES